MPLFKEGDTVFLKNENLVNSILSGRDPTRF
jgi:hypothetical protein